MPWHYDRIKPSAMPPCPWCRSSKAVKRDGVGDGVGYDCGECKTNFKARFDADPISQRDEEYRPRG